MRGKIGAASDHVVPHVGVCSAGSATHGPLVCYHALRVGVGVSASGLLCGVWGAMAGSLHEPYGADASFPSEAGISDDDRIRNCSVALGEWIDLRASPARFGTQRRFRGRLERRPEGIFGHVSTPSGTLRSNFGTSFWSLLLLLDLVLVTSNSLFRGRPVESRDVRRWSRH